MANKQQLKPVMVVIPRKKVDSSCSLPIMVNGITFDLSSPTHIIRLPTTKALSLVRDTHQTSSMITDASNTNYSHLVSNPPCLNTSPKGITPADSLTVGDRSSSHREVERKRKLKISTAIQQLAKCLPGKILGRVSHSNVLEEVIERIKKLKEENKILEDHNTQDEEGKLKSVLAKLMLENVLLKELKQLLSNQPICKYSEGSSTSMVATCTVGKAASSHQSWPVASLLAVNQAKTRSPSTVELSGTATNPPTPTSSNPNTNRIGIVQPWLNQSGESLYHSGNEISGHSLNFTNEDFQKPGGMSVAPHPNRGRIARRYKPYQTGRSYNSEWVSAPHHLSRHPAEFAEHSRFMQEHYSMPHDHNLMPAGHTLSYDTYNHQNTVWRPYSEPNRLSGFGLSHILSHSHMEQHPPSNGSFLVDSLLDDM